MRFPIGVCFVTINIWIVFIKNVNYIIFAYFLAMWPHFPALDHFHSYWIDGCYSFSSSQDALSICQYNGRSFFISYWNDEREKMHAHTHQTYRVNDKGNRKYHWWQNNIHQIDGKAEHCRDYWKCVCCLQQERKRKRKRECFSPETYATELMPLDFGAKINHIAYSIWICANVNVFFSGFSYQKCVCNFVMQLFFH